MKMMMKKIKKKFKKFLDFFKICVKLPISNSRKEIPLMMNPAVLSSRFSCVMLFSGMTEI